MTEKTPFDLDSLFVIPEFDESQMKTMMAEAYERCQANPNAFSNWFPAVEAAGIRHPKTSTITLSPELQSTLLDDKPADAQVETQIDALVQAIQTFGTENGYPLFIKTAFTSAKHYWSESCALPDGQPQTILAHVCELLNFQGMNGIETFTPELVVRKMIDVAPVFTAFEGQMPVTEEYRVFARDGVIEGYQPYWPVDSIQKPSITAWQEALKAISTPTGKDLDFMVNASERITRSLKGYWSVDFLKDKEGKLWLIDMAEGHRSYRNEADFRIITQPEQDLSC